MRFVLPLAHRLLPLGLAARFWPAVAIYRLQVCDLRSFCRHLDLDPSWMLLIRGCHEHPPATAILDADDEAWRLALRAVHTYLGPQVELRTELTEPFQRQLAEDLLALARRSLAVGGSGPVGSPTDDSPKDDTRKPVLFLRLAAGLTLDGGDREKLGLHDPSGEIVAGAFRLHAQLGTDARIRLSVSPATTASPAEAVPNA